MQVSARSLQELPIISFTTAETIGVISGVIIDQSRLKISFFLVEVPKAKKPAYLAVTEVREVTRSHCIVDADTSLTISSDLVRYKEMLSRPVLLINYRVVTASGHKLGKCYDFLFLNDSFALTKIYVKAARLQRFYINHHIIDVADVVRIEPNTIVVKDAFLTELREAKNALPVQSS